MTWLRTLRGSMNLLAISVIALLAANVPKAHGELEVIVPAYFYPSNGSAWDDLNSAASQVKITAIMNPASGPGGGQNADYVAAVDALRAAGGKVIGYVHTTFGSRPLSTVLSEIDDYASWYNLDGIFIDEMANTGPAQKLDYYRDIYNYVKGIDPNWELTGNPGINTIEQYMTWPTADRFIITENTGANYSSFTPSSWVADYPRSQFGNLIHTESSVSDMQNQLVEAIGNNAGAIYITDDAFPNPWDTLPSYWQAQIDAIEQLNASILPGDMDEDLDVDSDDLLRWSAGLGISTGATHYDGDADGDGDVDGQDFLAWQSQFGMTSVPAVAAALAVPEPGTFWLLLTAASIRFLVRARDRSL
ncbi:MAG: hypothetical protein GXP26_05160 [Planctomycetes bacterium]|nr:hypothetical protein [Planctomycetota bacterium]